MDENTRLVQGEKVAEHETLRSYRSLDPARKTHSDQEPYQWDRLKNIEPHLNITKVSSYSCLYVELIVYFWEQRIKEHSSIHQSVDGGRLYSPRRDSLTDLLNSEFLKKSQTIQIKDAKYLVSEAKSDSQAHFRRESQS